VTQPGRTVYRRGVQKFAIVLLIVAAACGGADAASKPKPKPKPIPIAEPGPLALTPDGGIVVGDRALKRIVRIDLFTNKRRIVAKGVGVPVALTYDDQARLYVSGDERIFRLEAGRKILVAGTGTRSHTGDGGPATQATFGGASGFEVDHDERIVVAEYDNWIRSISPEGTISTLVGTGADGYAGDGGPATSALLLHPHDVALQRDGVVIADSHNHVLRRVVYATGTITTIARDFQAPVLVDGGPFDTLYVADAGLGAVFKLDANGGGRTRVGAAFAPIGMAVDTSSNVYVAELEARRIVRIAPNGTRKVLVKP
jgi:DNA-binding beta-propeller fold protein YncE